MNYFKISGLMALCLLAAFAPLEAEAQYPDCTGQGQNLVGLAWSNGEFNIDAAPGVLQTATLYVFNPSGSNLEALEMRLFFDTANLFFQGVTYRGPVINVGTPPHEFIVGMATPLLPDVNGAVAIADIQFIPNLDTRFDFYATPVASPSLPGEMVLISDGNTLPMYPVSWDQAVPIANLNGPPLDYCGTPNQPPVAADDSAATQRNIGANIDLIANDSDPDSPLDPGSLVLGPTTSGGRLTDLGDGRVMYMPGHFTYEDTFTYTVADVQGAVSNVATVTVSVTQPYDPIETPDCTGEGQDMMGIVWENNQFSMPNAPEGQDIYGRVYVFNPSGGTVDGFEFDLIYDVVDGSSSVSFNPLMPYAATDIGDGHSYLLDEPLYPDANGAVPILELRIELGAHSGVDIYSSPSIIITPPAAMQLYTGGDPNATEMFPLGDDVTPIGSLNGEDLDYCGTVGNQAPVIGDIQNQSVPLGQPFTEINLNDYVQDEQDPTTLTWQATGWVELSVHIIANTAYVRTADPSWFGIETVTFTVEDSEGLTDSQDVHFTVRQGLDPFVKIVVATQDTFYTGTATGATDGFDPQYDHLITDAEPSLVFDAPPGMEDYAYVRHMFHDYSFDIANVYVDQVAYEIPYNRYRPLPVGEFCIYECIWNDNTQQYDCGQDCQYEIEGGKFYSAIWVPNGQWADIMLIEETAEAWLQVEAHPPYNAYQEVDQWEFDVTVTNDSVAPITVPLEFYTSFSPTSGVNLQLWDDTLGQLFDLWPSLNYTYVIPAASAEVRTFKLYVGTPGATGDTDGDGVPDLTDQCPGEDSSFFDQDGDGCIDPVIGGRHIEYWADGTFPMEYWIHQGDPLGITDDSHIAVIQEGFSAWMEDPRTDLSLIYMGETVDGVADGYDGIHTITFHDDEYPFPSGVIAVGLSTSYQEPDYDLGIRPGQIVDTDMMFNPLMAFRTDTSGPPDGTYLKGVVVHEAGHMLGISHSGVQSSTMFYVLPPDSTAASLEPEDRSAMFKAYPAAGSYAGTSHLEGTVTDGQTGLPVPGAIVFVMDDATGDTVGCDFTLPEDGSFHFIGLPDGGYRLAIHPLNGSSTIGYLLPRYINPLIEGTVEILFLPEFWDPGESNNDDPAAFGVVAVMSGATSQANFITNIDQTGPTIVAVSPADGATGVPIDSAILFRCDEAIDASTLAGNFYFAATGGGDFLLGVASLVEDGRTLAYVPTVNLEFQTTYQLDVGAGVTDLFGNPMGADFSMTFTTVEQPAVAMNNLVPRKGVAGSLLVINGAGFSGDLAGNRVTYGTEEWTVLNAAPSQLVVQVPDDVLPSTNDIQVERLDSGQDSNELSYTVLPPGEEAHGVETAVVNLFALPRQVEVSPGGDFVYIATDQGLSFVDVTNPTSPVAGSLGLGHGLSGLDVTPDGNRIYGISGEEGSLHRFGTEPVAELESVELNFRPRGILMDPSGQRAYLATDFREIQVLDIIEGSPNFLDQIGSLTTASSSLLGPMATDPAGNYLLALDGVGSLLIFDLQTFALHAEVEVLSAARDVVVDPRGERAYVTDDTGNASIISLTSFSNLLNIPTGGALQGAAIDPMGSFLYAVNHQLDNLDVIDLRSESATYHTISARLTQQVNPVDVALSPGGQYAYVIVESTQALSINSVGVGPSLGSLSRTSGPVGTKVVLAGTDFTGGTVTFNGIPATIERGSDTSVTIAVPNGAASGPVMVLGDEPGEVSNALWFQMLEESPTGGLNLTSALQPEGQPPLTGALRPVPGDKHVAVASVSGEIHLLDVNPNSPSFNQFIGKTDVLAGTLDDFVISPDGLTAYVVSRDAAAVFRFNINPNSASFGGLLGQVDLAPGSIPNYLAVSPDGRWVLAADPDARTVHIVELTAGTVITTLPLIPSGFLGRLAFQPDGLFAYVVGSDQVVVLDMDPDGPGFGTVAGLLNVGNYASDLAFNPDGTLCYVLTGPSTGSGDRALVTIDISNPLVPVISGTLAIPSTADALEENLVLSPAGDRALLNIRNDGFYLVDLPAGNLLNQADIVADAAKVGFDFSADGARVFGASAEDGVVSTFDFNSQQQMEIVWGDGQSGALNQLLNSSLRVRVTDLGTGEGLVGVPVTFTISTSGQGLAGAPERPFKPVDPAAFAGMKNSDHVGLNRGIPDGDKSGGETADNAVPIMELPFTDTGNTSDNADDYDETCPYDASESPDVVYSWIAGFSGAVTIDLCGSGYDTKVYVYETQVDPGNPWACDDDFYPAGDPCGDFRSRISEMPVIDGTTYLIVIDGYGGDSGDYLLNVVKDFDTTPWGYFPTDDPEARPTEVVLGADDFGFAEVNWNLGVTPGSHTVDVGALGAAGSPVQFHATAEEDVSNLPFTVVESLFAPAAGASDVAVTTAIQIAFNRAVAPNNLSATDFYLSADGGGTALPAVMGLAGGNTTASLTPNDVLEYNTTYTVVVGGGIVSELSEPLSNPQSFTFTTEEAPLAPELTGVNPPSGAELATVMISGAGLSSNINENLVYFGGTQATVTAADPDYILTRVPLGVGAGTVDVQVSVGGQTTNDLPFVVLEPSQEGADEVVVRVPTGSATRSATVSPDGAIVYAVAPEADLVIPIDLVNFTTLPSIPVGDMPWAISGHPDGNLAYVANRMSGDVSVLDLDPISPDYHRTISSIQVGNQPVDILVTPAGDRVLVANEESQDLSVIDSDSESSSFNNVINRVPVGSAAKSVTVSPDGARIFLGTDEGYIIIGSVDYGVVRRVDTGSAVKTVTVSPDGALLVVVDTAGTVTVYDISPGSPTEDQVVARVPTASGVKTATVSPDGARLYAVMEEGDIINVYALEVEPSAGVVNDPNTRPVFELVLLETLSAGENPQAVIFDPSGSGRFLVPNAGDNTVSVFDFGGPEGPGWLVGTVVADCPGPNTPLHGVEIDVFSTEDGEMLSSMITDETGRYEVELDSGTYNVTVVLPLGQTIEEEVVATAIAPADTSAIDWSLNCQEITARPRRMAFWKHQVGVAVRGWGWAVIDGPTICEYLDQIESHFNNHHLNQVAVYQPPESGECEDKLLVTREIFRLNWCEWWLTRAKQELMALLLNVSSGRLSISQVISPDGASVSQAITYVDQLIDDGDPDNDREAMRIAKRINRGLMVEIGIIPDGIPEISYRIVPKVFKLDQVFPNPFNPQTTVRFGVARPGNVSLKIFNVSGHLVHTLVDENMQAGTYTRIWAGTDNRGLPVASGVYFLRMDTSTFTKTRKMLLMK